MQDFKISEVAYRLGCHPNTIRNYERRGLIRPARNIYGARRFSLADIQKIRAILSRRWGDGGSRLGVGDE